MPYHVGTELLRTLEDRLVRFVMCLLYTSGIVWCLVGLRWITGDDYQFVAVPPFDRGIRGMTHRGRITG